MNKKTLIITVVLLVLAAIYWLSTMELAPIANIPDSGKEAVVETGPQALPYEDAEVDIPFSSKSSPDIGRYLTDKNGFTLYTYKKDGVQKSNCTGTCAETWIPFTSVGELDISKYQDELSKQINFTDRPDERGAQFSFGPSPLYYYSGDLKAGDVNGHGMANGDWSAVILLAQ